MMMMMMKMMMMMMLITITMINDDGIANCNAYGGLDGDI